MKYLYISLFMLVNFAVSAQNKFGVAIKLGGGLAKQSIKNEDIIAITSTGAFNFGGMAMFRFYPQWEIQAGLEAASKGAFITEDAITTTQHVVYLDLPFTIVRNFKITGLGSYYLGAGGYLAGAITGTNSFETPNSQTSSALAYGNDGDLQRYDAGLNFTTGLKLNNRLIFDTSYQLGLANLATTPLKQTGTSAIRNRLITVSLGYTIR